MLEGEHEVRVKDALPGQTVRFRITKKNSHRCEGMLLDVMKRAGNEIVSDCPHFGRCGGCSYRTLSYQDQLKLKEDQMIRLFKPVVKEVAPGPGSDCQKDESTASVPEGQSGSRALRPVLMFRHTATRWNSHSATSRRAASFSWGFM